MAISEKMLIAAGLVAVMGVTPSLAHHSFAMFDHQKTVVLDGTVKEFQWTNPHSWIQLVVKDPVTGKETEWSVEGGSPNYLARKGWRRNSIKVGDNARVTINPLKDGSSGGSLVSVSIGGATLNGEPNGDPTTYSAK
jgi:hypothetical protein